MAVDPDDVFRLLDPATEAGSDVAQDLLLWQKLKSNNNLIAPVVGGYANAFIGSHFNSNVRPFWLRENMGTGASATYASGNKHLCKLTTGTASPNWAVIDVDQTSGVGFSDATYEFGDLSLYAPAMIEFRFSSNINFTDHDILFGFQSGNSNSADESEFFGLQKGSTGTNWRFITHGLNTGGDKVSSDFVAGNNDNGTTYTSVRIVLDSQVGVTDIFRTYYDKDGSGLWIEQPISDMTLSGVSLGTVLWPVFKVKIASGVTAGDALLDHFVVRPFVDREL